MKIFRNILFSILSISCSGSAQNIEDDLIGIWAIHKVEYNGESIYNDFTTINIIIFNNNNNVSLPGIVQSAKDADAKWRLVKKEDEYHLVFTSKNHLLEGEYKLKIEDNGKTTKLTLNSNHLYLEIFKS